MGRLLCTATLVLALAIMAELFPTASEIKYRDKTKERNGEKAAELSDWQVDAKDVALFGKSIDNLRRN